jgi:hypothetical protein
MSADDKTLADKLIEFIEADSSHLTDPLTVAAECARQVALTSNADNPRDVAVAVNALMPPGATVFERHGRRYGRHLTGRWGGTQVLRAPDASRRVNRVAEGGPQPEETGRWPSSHC